ncbi:ribonuclease J [Lachnoanaerobaculum sp. Marseille-Q4761]|uniref:ribonuclease J n=1 Tax=Lachnoanaerobaculum sp. Marseille-Q4761 TaxID=2819511 RepID=UPI001FB5F23E|nr:ribonuclease J [Lachnoanaerobaculum sp. Marseille-Q4761]
MNENEKNPLLNMQRIRQESKELIEAGANELSDIVPEKKVKKEKTVNARLKHEQGNKKTTGQKKSTAKEKSVEAGTKAVEESKAADTKTVKKTAAKKTKASDTKKETLETKAEAETKKTKARYVGPADKNVPSLAEQVSSILMENKKKRGRTKKAAKKVKIIPLGGLEQIGMNITAFEYDDSIIVVDCGLAFPSDDMLGIDLVIPDITYLKDNYLKVKGFCITHGHEDHIGALPYILKQLNVPVYGTRLTCALIEKKLKEHQIEDSAKLNIVKYGDNVNLGDFKVEFVKTNHSIADAASLAIFTPAGTIFHTGDFKVDYTPVFGDPADLGRMAEIGKAGCLAMLSDSTNATRPGFTMSEKTVGKTFDLIFAEHRDSRIIVATFASNVDRVQQIINTAYKYDRKVVVEGRSMVNVIGTAADLGYIDIPEGTLIDIDHLKDYPLEKTVIITTGSQGESMAALSRMASSIHRKVEIVPEDVIIMSSTPIPGNEKAVSKVINELSMKGAEVIFQDTHVSGHACQEEIKLMYSLLKPKFALPVHGEYRHLMAGKGLAEAVGIPSENVLIMSSGDVVELSEDSCKITGHVEAGGVFVDGLGVGDVGNIVLRDRQSLSQNGIIIVAMSLEHGTNRLLSGPDIVSRGFVYVRESTDLMNEASAVVREAVADCLHARITDWSKIKNVVRDSLSEFLWKRMKRNPVILPIIMEIH